MILFSQNVIEISILVCYLLVPLKNIPYDVVQKVVELLYMREVKVSADMESHVLAALKFLRVDLIYPEAPMNGKIEKCTFFNEMRSICIDIIWCILYVLK